MIVSKKGARLNLTPFFIVGVAGFEPATPWSQTRCASRTALYPVIFQISSPFNLRIEPVTLPMQNRDALAGLRYTPLLI
jgi:hypothetical protein